MKTPFYDRLAAHNGRFVDFHGWLMPVQFEGIIAEHRHVREAVGVFDVSHMGEIELRGPQAVAAVNRVITNDLAGLEDGQACYTPVCRPDGGIVDDVIAYRRAVDDVLVCCNASNREKDVAWFQEHAGAMCDVRDASDEYGQLAVQGPRAPELLREAFPEVGEALAEMPPFHHRTIRFEGAPLLVSTTGYTGERGYELYLPVAIAEPLWDRLFAVGEKKFDLRPIGLGARDTLRLEMRFCLYGNDIDDTTTPLEAGLGWTIRWDKDGGFVGQDALARQRADKPKRMLVGFRMIDRGIPRQGYELFAGDEPDRKVGHVTSGTQSPSLGKAIGLAYVDVPFHKRKKELLVDIRGRRRRAKIIKTPFLNRK